jgi:molecular chaperone GrpE
VSDQQQANAPDETPDLKVRGPDGAQDATPEPGPPSAQEWAELRQKAAERDEYLDRLQRERADAHNSKQRLLKDTASQKLYATERLVADLLPVLDNLELAIEATPRDAVGEVGQALLEGVLLVSRQTLKVLADHGVEPIDAVELPFDPAEHEAIMQQPSTEYAKGAVIAQTRKGYRLRDRVIRPAQVIVSAGPPVEASDQAPSTQGQE